MQFRDLGWNPFEFRTSFVAHERPLAFCFPSRELVRKREALLGIRDNEVRPSVSAIAGSRLLYVLRRCGRVEFDQESLPRVGEDLRGVERQYLHASRLRNVPFRRFLGDGASPGWGRDRTNLV